MQQSPNEDVFVNRLAQLCKKWPQTGAYLDKHTKDGLPWRLCDWHALGLQTMGMKSNKMSEIENNLLVTVRLMDPLRMLHHLVLKASQDLVKAHRSCADQLDRTPSQYLTDGALQKCKKLLEDETANANATVRTTTSTTSFMMGTLIDDSRADTKCDLVDKHSTKHQPQSKFAAKVTLFTGDGDKDGFHLSTVMRLCKHIATA